MMKFDGELPKREYGQLGPHRSPVRRKQSIFGVVYGRGPLWCPMLKRCPSSSKKTSQPSPLDEVVVGNDPAVG
jgi:hypothetical protein